MKYSARFFRDTMPEWKRKKDPILSRIFYRRAAFYTASAAANIGISANAVSYVSGVIGIAACVCFLLRAQVWHIVGAALVNIWLILDCTDGCLARSVRSQPFGEFADGISSYILVGLLCTAMGVAAYYEGGVLFSPGSLWIVLLGALASSSDSLMRLVYQKYKNTERDLSDQGILEVEHDDRTDHSKVGSLRVRLESELGIGGILPLAVLTASIVRALDLVVLYCFLYYGASFALVLFIYVRKAIRAAKAAE